VAFSNGTQAGSECREVSPPQPLIVRPHPIHRPPLVAEEVAFKVTCLAQKPESLVPYTSYTILFSPLPAFTVGKTDKTTDRQEHRGAGSQRALGGPSTIPCNHKLSLRLRMRTHSQIDPARQPSFLWCYESFHAANRYRKVRFTNGIDNCGLHREQER